MLTNIIMAVLLFNLGFFARWIFFKNKPIGVIRVDRSDPTEKNPYLFLEIPPGGMKELLNTKYATFLIIQENYLSSQDVAQK